MSSLAPAAPAVNSAVEFVVARTVRQQYWDGFDQYCDCARTGDWLDAGELASLTPAERKGYNAAADAQAEAEYAAHRGNVNAYGDYTEQGF
jgi:hypothetical protein